MLLHWFTQSCHAFVRAYAQVHPLQLALLFADGGVRLHGMHPALSWALEHVLPPFARALGFSASYPAYVSAGATDAEE